MGTNYYLMRKCEFDPLRGTPASLGCCGRQARDPQELANGWAWGGRRYPDLESLNKDFYQELHIGKSSAGWRFLLATYPERNPKNADEIWLDGPIDGLGDWIRLFNDPLNRIVDECGAEVSPERMIGVIADRGDGLLAHEEGRYCKAMGDGCAYDLALSGNDPSCGLVFC